MTLLKKTKTQQRRRGVCSPTSSKLSKTNEVIHWKTAASWLSSGISICRYKTQLHIFLNPFKPMYQVNYTSAALLYPQSCSRLPLSHLQSFFILLSFLHRKIRLPLIRTHCHLKATAGIIGAILHISNDCSETCVCNVHADDSANRAASLSTSASPTLRKGV